jgi:hypothetical protein
MLTMALPPQVIAARDRHSLGTDTETAKRPLWMTIPTLNQYVHRPNPLTGAAVRSIEAGGTERTPSAGR